MAVERLRVFWHFSFRFVMASLRIVFRRWRLYAEKRKFGPLDEYVIGGQVGVKK